ncbi:plasmid mobilization relaxosome protein MobC [Aeromonas caviae]|uniref:plasmid mobilization relaxosome protein MobC n=1 Tax=Aeromonas caviae TaxID=648 RepID=UPI0029DE6C0C|nr:plasmid mobilization relaxosome protein MobC [Aeromonas caviae]MDX7645622.1 plasmid mobilization relaxosome protein MobC [Aeromonas caviae]
MTKPERKTTTASLRLDPATLAKWRKGASDEGQTLSDWLRSKVDADQQTHIAPARSRRERDPRHLADPALMRQLAALGSNLNQIARAVNECRLVGSLPCKAAGQ